MIAVLVAFLIPTQSIEAQFLNKLQKRVEQKVENLIVEKTANKAAEKVFNSMDNILENKLFEIGTEKADPNLVSDSYYFSWNYSMKMSSKSGEMVFDYFLKLNISYLGLLL